MCWSFGASAILTILGVIATIFLFRSEKYKRLGIVLLYFTLMEALQAFTYPVIDQCGLPANEILTMLGFFHIVFQPIFINMAFMFFIPHFVERRIAPYVYGISFLGAIVMLFKLAPVTFVETCAEGAVMCGQTLCSMTETWHMAWSIPFNGIDNLFLIGYAIPAFVLPLIYGAWRPTIYHIILGPLLAWSLSSSPNQWPAIWCLFSIAFVLMVFIKPIREWMFTKKWYVWNYPFKKDRIKLK